MADILLDSVPDIMAAVHSSRSSDKVILKSKGLFQNLREPIVANSRYAHIMKIWRIVFRLARTSFSPRPASNPAALLRSTRRYATVPVVRRSGGLADTVTDTISATVANSSAIGFLFENAAKEDMLGAVQRALQAYKTPLAWRRIQINGMSRNFGWRGSAAKYASLYEEICGVPRMSVLL